jgi:hypothetical protein
MIQPLRAAHRRAFVALGLVLPAILLAGLRARRPRSPVSQIGAQTPDSAQLVGTSNSLWRNHAIRSELYRNQDGLYVVLLPVQELNEPDLLVYWTSNPPQGESLPADAMQLGAFAPGKAIALPKVEGPAHLVLFSLAHHMVVDTAAVDKLP